MRCVCTPSVTTQTKPRMSPRQDPPDIYDPAYEDDNVYGHVGQAVSPNAILAFDTLAPDREPRQLQRLLHRHDQREDADYDRYKEEEQEYLHVMEKTETQKSVSYDNRPVHGAQHTEGVLSRTMLQGPTHNDEPYHQAWHIGDVPKPSTRSWE